MLDDLIEYTTRNVFLTGKAGTGKTTFLNQFIKKTKKKYIVAAPTGIAAINAGGSTIHSLFGLPLNNFVPTTDEVDINEALNRTQLLPHLFYRSEKRTLLRELELLIIDEVSMLRADILDAIDFALRHVRHSSAPFGGVQLLLVGDLYQLPPVVRNGRNTLDQYYSSPFFFEAHALKEKPLVTYRLEKIYRQSDQNFIEILNQIRLGEANTETLHKLNERFTQQIESLNTDGYIYLVSHNHLAEKINREQLDKLPSKSFVYNAYIDGDFRTQQYPNEAELELKIGAQVMFIKNDSSPNKAYYNGKIGEISSLNNNEIQVKFPNETQSIKVNKELWENKSYQLDKSTQEIKQEVMGSYQQFPIKLAWAVTIHKSQGLTFDKVIIDAGQAFASGQVYVALSRCTHLEGIILTSKITQQQIFKDQRIPLFEQQTDVQAHLEQIIENERYQYAIHKMKETLNFKVLYDQLLQWQGVLPQQKKFESAPVLHQVNQALQALIGWEKTSDQFTLYLEKQFHLYRLEQNNWDLIINKSEKAIAYFLEQLLDQLVLPTIEHIKQIKGQKGLKGYTEQVKAVLELCQEKLIKLKNSTLFDHALYHEDEESSISADPKDIEKLSSEEISFRLFEEGKNLTEIAQLRELKEQTVFVHLAERAIRKQITLQALISEEKIQLFEQVFKSSKKMALKAWKEHLPPHFEYHEIRLLLRYFEDN